MPKTLLKTRWRTWEEQCIQDAFKEKVQLKIIAAGMGRSLSSVRKKIKRLGLPIKSIKQKQQATEALLAQLLRMRIVLKKFAPLEFSEKGQLALSERYWINTECLSGKDLKKGECVYCISQDGASFSLKFPLHYMLSEDPVIKRERNEKLVGTPFCVPLRYMEEWADSEGFQPIPKHLAHHGLSYWKQGEYFSKTQLLMYVNRIRLEKRLQPLAYHEEG